MRVRRAPERRLHTVQCCRLATVMAMAALLAYCLCTSKNRLLSASGEWRPGGIQNFKAKGILALHPIAENGFRPKQCNREGVDTFPNGALKWQQNAPNFLIAGVPKAGTTTIANLIRSHPTVFGPAVKELNFFRNLPFQENLTISVKEARAFMLDEKIGYPTKVLQKHPHALSYDGSPGYLFYSSIIMPQILCVCPWIKIILVLRDPIERFLSDFQYEIARKSLWVNTSVARIVDEELQLMRLGGLDSITQIPGSEEESLAWHRYQSLTRRGWLGKGVYDIQLRHLFQAMKDFGIPQSRVLILTTSNLRDDIVGTHQRILSFLNLHGTQIPFTRPRNQGSRKRRLHPDIRRRLESFYGPYNGRLNALLKDRSIVFNTYEHSKQNKSHVDVAM